MLNNTKLKHTWLLLLLLMLVFSQITYTYVSHADHTSNKISTTKVGSQSYIVEKGDTLYSIAARHGVTLKEIIDANGITNPDLLQVGQKLKINSHESKQSNQSNQSNESSQFTQSTQSTPKMNRYVAEYISQHLDFEDIHLSSPQSSQKSKDTGVHRAVNQAANQAVNQAANQAASQVSQRLPEAIHYQVRHGDTLYVIAASFGVSIENLIISNQISNPNLLRIGQRLRIPSTDFKSVAAIGVGGDEYAIEKVLNSTLTAYTAGYESTGKSKGHPEYGITYSGKKVKEGRTIAVDPNVIALGKTVYIEGIGLRTAEDIGSAIKGAKIDVFIEDLNKALEFGVKKNVKVYVLSDSK